MKRWLWLAAAAVIVIAAGVTLVALPRGQEWTSSSPEAVAEFQAGIDARSTATATTVTRRRWRPCGRRCCPPI